MAMSSWIIDELKFDDAVTVGRVRNGVLNVMP